MCATPMGDEMTPEIEDAIYRVLRGLEKYRDVSIPIATIKAPKHGARRYKRWSPEKIQRLVDLWQANVPRTELPVMLGSTMGAVQAKLNLLGLRARDRKRARLEVGHGG